MIGLGHELSPTEHEALGLKRASSWTESKPRYIWPEPCYQCKDKGRNCVVQPLTAGSKKGLYLIEKRCEGCGSKGGAREACGTTSGTSGERQYRWLRTGVFVLEEVPRRERGGKKLDNPRTENGEPGWTFEDSKRARQSQDSWVNRSGSLSPDPRYRSNYQASRDRDYTPRRGHSDIDEYPHKAARERYYRDSLSRPLRHDDDEERSVCHGRERESLHDDYERPARHRYKRELVSDQSNASHEIVTGAATRSSCDSRVPERRHEEDHAAEELVPTATNLPSTNYYHAHLDPRVNRNLHRRSSVVEAQSKPRALAVPLDTDNAEPRATTSTSQPFFIADIADRARSETMKGPVASS